jgi:hypothetical protein
MSNVAKARVRIDPSGVINVHVKPEILFDLKSVQTLQASILGRLGCLACCSGFQIIFRTEENEFSIG